MLRKSLASLAGSLGRLGLCDLGGVRQQGAALEQRASRTLVSLRSFCSRGSLQNFDGAASRAGAPDSSLSTAAAGGGGGRRQLSTSAARLQQQQAGAPQPGAAQRPAGEESLDQIRARVFGYHVGNGLRSGRKVLRGALRGPRAMEWYPVDPTKLDPFMPDMAADRAKLKLDRLRRRGKAPPKKGQGKRSGKKK